jgi:hypothetical protein
MVQWLDEEFHKEKVNSAFHSFVQSSKLCLVPNGIRSKLLQSIILYTQSLLTILDLKIIKCLFYIYIYIYIGHF